MTPSPPADTLSQVWPAFALVAGLLLIGSVAASDGLFEWVGGMLARLPGGNLALFCYLLALIALVTVVLNLDTSVVFVTPIVLQASRSRGLDETAFLYGSVFMANSASLLLPGSNLTNLLVLAGEHTSGGNFAAGILPAWVASVVVTTLVLVGWRWRDFRRSRSDHLPPASARVGLGLVGTVGATGLVLALARPALPVLVLGVLVASFQVAFGPLRAVHAARAVNVALLLGLFGLSLLIGSLARQWGDLGSFMSSIGPWQTAGVATGASVAINNLPAAVLLTAHSPVHSRALLTGLNLGPNLAVSGSLAAMLWMRVSRAAGASPSALAYSRVGVVLVPISIAAALLALQLF